MKIKMDFVSNSSSTSFIYISKKTFTEESFFKAIGVDKSSPLFDFFTNMYYVLDEKIKNGKIITHPDQISSVGEYPEFTPEVVERVRVALEEDKEVVLGGLSSDDELAASLLCMEIFEIDSEDFYINAYDNYW